MEEKDTYQTLARPSEGIYKEKGSKFIAYAFATRSEEEIKEQLNQVRKLHHSARHVCYAWKLGPEGEHFRANDDGEPSNSAGKPILGQIQSAGLTYVLIAVVRYFGGVKLGVGGLINAYRSAAADALENNKTIEKIVGKLYRVEFSYEGMNDVMRIVKEESLEIRDQQFDLHCVAKIWVRKNKHILVEERLKKVTNLKLKFLEDA